jgi:4-amino-4-deoxy-L-arabinose transferase-like glycosyltransferase
MNQRFAIPGLASPALAGLMSSRAALPVALFAWFAITAWVRILSIPDEGRYVGVALEMLWSGNWLVPTLDTLPYFHKPPLFYWLTAASLATFGINEWAARLPSLLVATGCAYGVFLFVRRWVGAAHAKLALLVLATTPFFYGGAQFANLDMLVAACMAGTILCAADALLAAEGGRPRRLSLAAAYAFAALGVLAKGLIGIAIPVLVVGAWLLNLRKPGLMVRLVWLPGVALFALIAMPWFALMQARYPGFLQYLFVHHQFERFAVVGFNNQQPFWFLIAVFAGATLPWCPLLASGLKQRHAMLEEGAQRQVRALMWTWLIATLIFFSIPPSKLIGYVLVAVPPFGVLVADAMIRAGGSLADVRRQALRMAAVAVLVCAGILTVVIVRERDTTPQLAAEIRPLMTSPTELLAVVARYPFSLPFYLRHKPPMHIVLNWDDASILQSDSWRRELYEAAAFDRERGKAVLLRPAALGLLVACAKQPVWVIGPAWVARAWLPGATGLERIGEKGGQTIWRKMPSPGTGSRPDCGP